MSRRDCDWLPAYNGMVTRMPAPFAFLPGRFTLPPDWNPVGHLQHDGEWVEVDRLGFFTPVEFNGYVVPLAP